MAHPSEYGRLRFCPKCGCEKIRRDYFMAETADKPGVKQVKVGCEYICDSCGFAFWISKSRRRLTAEANMSEARKRADVRFTEKCVGSEVARTYIAQRQGPPMLKMLKEKVLRRMGLSNQCAHCKHTYHRGRCHDSNSVKDGVRIPCECEV